MSYLTSRSSLLKSFLVFFMVPMLSYLGVALILSPHITRAAGNTYHVRQDGGGDCTTIQECVNKVQGPGDTVIVHAGTYGSYNTWVQTPEVSGSDLGSGAITLRNAPGETVWLQGQLFVGSDAARFWIVDGINVDGGNIGRNTLLTGPNCIVRNLEITRSLYYGFGVGAGSQVINVRSYNHGNGPTRCGGVNGEAEGQCHGFYAHSPDIIIDGLEAYDNNGQGVAATFGADNWIVKNSKFHNNAYALQQINSFNMLYYNNVLYDNREQGMYIKDSPNGSNYFNNTVYNTPNGLTFENSAGNTARNNIFYQSDPITCAGGTCTNNLTTDPSFVNAGSGDFHITQNSPAKDAGMTLPEVPCDFDGNSRPAGSAYDIGAYEYGGTPSSGCSKGGGGTTPTPTPTNQPPVITISAIPASISVVGQGVTLSWSVTNATSCTASGGWSGSQALGGNTRFTPSATTIYTLTCQGPGGSGQGSATVTVGQSSSCTLYTSGSTIPQGFGVPWDVTSPQTLLLNANCTPPTVLFKAGDPNTTKTLYVYKTAYTAPSGAQGWTPVDLFGSQLISGSWYKSFAQGVAQMDTATPNYYVAYTCSWTGSKWMCGCRDSSCAQSYWQIQKIQP
jgi:hypothetical protein